MEMHPKYPSLKAEMKALKTALQANPGMGVPLGKGCYKIGMPLKKFNDIKHRKEDWPSMTVA